MNFLLIFMMNLSLRRCVDCKYFKRPFFAESKFGKCLMFPKKEEPDTYYWVTGIKEKPNVDYSFCSVARDIESMCGMQGKKFESRP